MTFSHISTYSKEHSTENRKICIEYIFSNVKFSFCYFKKMEKFLILCVNNRSFLEFKCDLYLKGY